MKKLLICAAAIAILTSAPLKNAAAQDIKFQNQSVTIYELEPAEYTASVQSRPTAPSSSVTTYAPAPAEAVQNVQANNIAAASTPNASAATPTAPDNGWLGALWSGRANIGASLQTGNTEQDAINADASIKARWPKANGDPLHRTSAKAEINLQNEDDESTEDNRRLDLAYDYFFAPKWFLNTTAGFEQDDIDQLDLRTTIGVGLGHQVFERDNLNLQYVVGPTYLREEFETGTTDNSAALRWALDYDQKIWDDVFQLFHNHELIVPGDDTNAYLLDTKTGVRIPLKKGLVATGEIDFQRDNAPEPGVEKDDTTYAFKLGYEW